MKKRLVAWLTVMLMMLSCFGTALTVGAAEVVTASRKYNVVLVVDASSSMDKTDPEGWRFEAINEFLSLLSMKGNYVGSVVFNEEILSTTKMSSISSKGDKDNVLNTIKSVKPVGYTNIGDALAKANELLEKGDSSLPSVVLLLSDGNTEMPSSDAVEKAMKVQDAAIQDAKNNETPVYCVGLNANGTLDPTELSNIAMQTKGLFKTVSSAQDLKDVYKDFYKLIFGSDGKQAIVSLPTVQEFTVPTFGVEEVNILIDGHPSGVKLTQPSGVAVSDYDLQNMTTQGNTFTNIKVENPLSGTWKVELNGEPGQTVTINFIPNLDMTLKTEADGAESYKRGDSIVLTTKIVSDGSQLTDNAIYQQYPATLKVVNANNSSDTKTINAVAVNGVYKAEVSFDNVGTYYVTASIDIGFGDIAGNTLNLNVGNSIPKPIEEKCNIIEYGMSFGKKAYTYELNEMVSDEDEETMSFMLDKAYFDADEYKLEDGKLIVTPKSEKEGSFTIIATDASGASCELNVNITYKNLLKTVLLVVAAVVAAVGLLWFLINYIAKHKPYKGSITIIAFDRENNDVSAPMTDWPPRGPKKIESINIESCIKGVFYGSGNDYVNLSFKGKVYCDGRTVKKIKIYDGTTSTITTKDDGMKGIEVSFTTLN